MIYYDISEARENSKLPKDVIEYGVSFDDLEQVTGADFVIIPEKTNYEKYLELKQKGLNISEIAKSLELPLQDVAKLSVEDTEFVLHNWLFAGAILVQRKSGYDFLNSFGTRLNDSIARMCEVSHKQYQRVVLVTHMFSKINNMVSMDGKTTNFTWNSYLGELSSIKYKGACVEFIPSDDCILGWIKAQESLLMKYKREHIKWIVPTVYYPADLPDLDDPFQLMRPVRDARRAVVTIPGWGSDKTNKLYDYVKEVLQIAHPPSLYDLLHYATSFETAKHCAGIGSGLIRNARTYMDLQDGEYLAKSNINTTRQIGNIEVK